jgi:hypothetical protein
MQTNQSSLQQNQQYQQQPQYQQQLQYQTLLYIPNTQDEIDYFYPSNFQFTPEQNKIIAKQKRLPHPVLDNIALTQDQINILNNYHRQIIFHKTSPQTNPNMRVYYEMIRKKISELFNDYPDGIDRFALNQFASNATGPIPQDKMGLFFKHLLNYTYASTATEIENHQEVNKHLVEINKKLLELLNKDKINMEPKQTLTGP